jgi:hypothetical protein
MYITIKTLLIQTINVTQMCCKIMYYYSNFPYIRGIQTFSPHGSFESSLNVDGSQIINNKKINIYMNVILYFIYFKFRLE